MFSSFQARSSRGVESLLRFLGIRDSRIRSHHLRHGADARFLLLNELKDERSSVRLLFLRLFKKVQGGQPEFHEANGGPKMEVVPCGAIENPHCRALPEEHQNSKWHRRGL